MLSDLEDRTLSVPKCELAAEALEIWLRHRISRED
jgi:hypothetical protein